MTGRFQHGMRVAAAVLAVALGAAGQARAQVGPVQRGGTGPGSGSGPVSGSDDLELIAHVVDRLTYGRTEELMALVKRIGPATYLKQQLRPDELPENPVLLSKLAALPPVDPANPQWDIDHLYADFLLHAVYSSRQLNEVMAEFWENHFDTQVPLGATGTPERYRNVEWLRIEKHGYRAHALGRFRDLLGISAKSPAMSYFLGNYQNRVGAGNENYARELLELHTLGVDNGYTQQDVQEVARVFTGWQISDLSRNCSTAPVDRFCFSTASHDPGQKVVLGEPIPSAAVPAGQAEGERVLDVLAAHPGTARFVCGKLVEKFVSDDRPERVVSACASTFLATGGDIRASLSAILLSPELVDPKLRLAKVRTPLELVAATVRNLEGDTDGSALWGFIASQGQRLFQNDVPTGYAETGGEWVGTNSFLQRWKWADTFTHSTNARYTCDPWQIASRNGVAAPDAVVDYFLALLVRGHHAGPVERGLLVAALLNGQTLQSYDFNSNATRTGIRNLVSLIIGFPEYNLQ